MLTKRLSPEQLAKDAEKVIGELLPVQIVDQRAYMEYKRLSEHPMLNERRHVVTSTGKRFSLGTAIRHIERYIEDLPEAEQKQIWAMRKVWNSIQCKCNSMQRKAYGTTVDGEGRYQRKGDKFENIKKEMIELFGRMFTAKEVHEIVVQQFEMNCTLQAVMNFRDRNIDEINAKIEDHKRTYSDIRLGHKRSRLEELTWLYLTRKRIYEQTKKGDDHRLLLMTLEQLRKEIEGDSLRIDGNINANIELTIQDHINRELFSNFPLKELILARVAARAKLAMGTLLLEINKSYYNTFINASPDAQVEMPTYPSTQTYDFDNIRRLHAQAEHNAEIAKATAVTVISPEQGKAANSVKEALLAKLKNKSEHVNFNKEKLQGKFIDKANSAE